MVEPLEITGNWQPQEIGPTTNYNVEKIYETTVDQKYKKFATVIVGYTYTSLQVLMLAMANVVQ